MNSFTDQLAKLTAASFVSAIGALVVVALASAAVLPTRIWIAILVATATISYLLIRLFLKRLFVVYPRLSGDLEVLVKHLVYRLVIDDGQRTIIYRRRYQIRALRDLDMIREPFLWTGSDPAPPVVIGGTVELRDVVPDLIWKVAELRLPRTLKKGEDYSYELEWRLDDSDRRSRPFFSAPINEATRKLVFDLYLPEGLGVDQVIVEERRSIDSVKPFKQRTLLVTDGHVRWEKAAPARFFYFCMRWMEPR